MTEQSAEQEPGTLDCGHVSTCWCGRCHLCEDVTQDDDTGDAGDDE